MRAWVADAGYASAANFDALADVPLLVAITKNGVDGEQHDETPIPEDH